MEHLSLTHPINQHPSCDRYAEMTQFVNHTTTKSKSRYSTLNIDSVFKEIHQLGLGELYEVPGRRRCNTTADLSLLTKVGVRIGRNIKVHKSVLFCLRQCLYVFSIFYIRTCICWNKFPVRNNNSQRCSIIPNEETTSVMDRNFVVFATCLPFLGAS